MSRKKHSAKKNLHSCKAAPKPSKLPCPATQFCKSKIERSKPLHPQTPRQWTIQDLINSSPTPQNLIPRESKNLIRKLLPEERLLCIGTGYKSCKTGYIAEFGGLQVKGVIVPAYMRKPKGYKVGFKRDDPHAMGWRTKDNVGLKRYVVFRQVNGSLEEQVDAIFMLRKVARLASVIREGPMQLEAWFSCAGLSDEEIYELKQRGLALGATQCILADHQCYALPGGWNHRENIRHAVIFWDPSVMAKAESVVILYTK